MIDAKQIRAARALLGWSQVDLAREAGLAQSSIKNIEQETGTARRESLEQVRRALEAAGIEFGPASGVRVKSHVVTVHDGRRATAELYESIFETAQRSPDREVLVLGLDERAASERDGADLLQSHARGLAAAGIRKRILVREGEAPRLGEPVSYRCLPGQYFVRTSPVYIYGDKVAFNSGTLRRQSIIIDNPAVAQQMRHLFSLLWDRATMPVFATPATQRGAR